MKKTMKKRILSMILVFMMVIGMMPTGVMAGEIEETPDDAAVISESESVAETGESEMDPEQMEAAFALSSLEIAVGGNAIESAEVQTLTPAFDGETTEYSTPILDYEGDKNNRFVLVKATVPEGITMTAKCGSSNTAELTSGEWGLLQVQGGYFYAPTYSGPINTGAYNEVKITLSKEGESNKTYTITIPMQPDINNQSLSWKMDLNPSVYMEKGAEDKVLTVKAEHKNRPLECKDEINYQWYSNTTASNEGGTLIEGATEASYHPSTKDPGTVYYYAVASCKDLTSITSKVTAVTVSELKIPESIKIICEHPYTIPNTWTMALGGVSYVAKVGDTLHLTAVDENGNETPVEWSGSLNGGTMQTTLGSTNVYTINNTSYSYVTVTSLFDSGIKSEEKVIQVEDYSITQYNKTPSVTLSNDGQTAKEISSQGGLKGYNIWSYEFSKENIAKLITDLSEKPSQIKFKALRPGTIDVSFDLDLNGDGAADGNGHTDAAVLTINGISVEDAEGNLTKTYMEISAADANPAVSLTALSSVEDAAFTWSSSDETVATVDEDGLVTAQSVGSVIISASDGTYTGGIKVVVSSAETPYFEQIDFSTTSTWGTGLLNTTWKTADFKAATLKYTGLAMTKAAAGTLTLNAGTLYNTDKYTAVAAYTDMNGEKQSIPINSGAVTNLTNLPFETNTITITLTDKEDDAKKTVYSFEVTRPRDTTKTIASSGIVFVPDGREVWKDKYNEKSEGIMYVANADGTFAQYQGVDSRRLYYRTYAMNGLENFSLTLKGSTAYTHIRFSTDDGVSWTYLGQTGAGGVSTGKIAIPTPAGEEHSVVKVQIQILDDFAYTANTAAGKDGFADSEPNTYTLWVEQIPAADGVCDILTAATDRGDWYPAFDKNRISYRLIVAPGAEAPILTYTVSENAAVTINGTSQTPDPDGTYTLTLTNASQNVLVTAADGVTSKTYTFGYSERSSALVPDKVVDYLSVNSQYTNGSGGGYGISPQQTLTGGLLSLGNFGGYVTFWLEDGLKDDPKHTYGVDFYIDGNAFDDISTGTGLGSMEPGQVWVSEDGSQWYALAGSEHYEASTLWDYTVTYTKTATGGTSWADNYGNTDKNTHGRSFAWPNPEIYTMNDLAKKDTITLSGILLPCVDGTITGTDAFNSFSKGGKFGYVDVLVNGTANPYLANENYENQGTGFDLAWAVDTNGNPVDVSGREFHYVKVVTASNIMAGSANEKSTEVAELVRAVAGDSEVGVTAAPTGVTISDGKSEKNISFIEGQQIYEAELEDMQYVTILVNGTSEGDNIYVNNQRVESGEAAAGIKISKEQKLVRIIVQSGEKEPVIRMLKLSSSSVAQELIDSVKITVSGAGRLAETTDGKIYTAEVGYRMNSIGITANALFGSVITINGEAVKESYDLADGENVFTITAEKDDTTHSVTLKVTKEKKPETTGKITVYFSLLGDTCHGEDGQIHTLEKGNLITWIEKTAYEIDAPVTAIDLIELALKDKYELSNPGGNYIDSVNGISEFDNGANSGWMYTVNGYHSRQGVAEQKLADGDEVILHYTDDWTLENNDVPGEEEGDEGTGEGDDKSENPAAADVYEAAGSYLKNLGKDYTPIVNSIGGDWMVLGLVRGDQELEEGYFDGYLVNVETFVKENINDKEQLHRAKSTENSRVILALTALGEDVTDVAGHNLLEGLTDMKYVKKQGINGPIWALIAFDSHDYEIPAGGDVTREALIETILDAQKADGGWTLSGDEADSDMTGMALQALAPYYNSDADVKAAVDQALVCLSEMQMADGSFGSTDGISAESCAQVIAALSALGIDPDKDERFVKNGYSVVDALCGFAVEGGGFMHIPNTDRDGMATEQGYYALVAYYRYLNGENDLFDMSDVTISDENQSGADTPGGDIPGSDIPGDEPGTDNPGSDIPGTGDPGTDNPEKKTYKILSGDNSTWKKNSDGSITIRSDGEFEDFLGLLMDGKEIDPKNYTAKSGSTIVTLKGEYLDTLKKGEHKVTFLFEDGEAVATLTIAAESAGNKMGDDTNMTLYITMLMIGMAGAATVMVTRKRQIRR